MKTKSSLLTDKSRKITFENPSQVEENISRVLEIIKDLDEDPDVTEEYINAITDQDIEKINWFKSMGKSPRHRIVNVAYLRHSLRFGFTQHVINDADWLEITQDWREENFCLKVKGDNAYHNHFTLAESPNHKWAYSFTLVYGSGSSYGSPYTVYDQPIDTREEALNQVIAEITKDINEKIESAQQRPDNTNYNIPYMHKVLQRIDEINPRSLAKTQLSLF